jgi:anti-sigma B factor antagonist
LPGTWAGHQPLHMAMDFEIDDRPVGDDGHIVAVSGEIDLFTAPEFKQRIGAPIDAGVAHVIVDLTNTTFVDSSSLGVLIGAHRRLRRRGGTMVVVCDNDAIVKTLRITGLDGVFTLVSTLGDALDGDRVSSG